MRCNVEVLLEGERSLALSKDGERHFRIRGRGREYRVWAGRKKRWQAGAKQRAISAIQPTCISASGVLSCAAASKARRVAVMTLAVVDLRSVCRLVQDAMRPPPEKSLSVRGRRATPLQHQSECSTHVCNAYESLFIYSRRHFVYL